MTTSSRALPGFRCAQCGASWAEQVAEAAWDESRAEREVVWRAVDAVTVTVPPPWISWTAE